MSTNARTLSEAVDSAITRRLAETFVARPAAVVSYDAATQTVSAKPLQKDWQRVDEETEKSVSLPILARVPVVFPGPITFPISAGDVVLLVYADRSLDVWKSSGGEADPIDKRSHSLRDAVAIPLLVSFNDARPGVPTDAICLNGPTLLGSNAASVPVAKEGSAVIGFAGPFAVSANVAPGAGSPTVKVP